MAPSPTSDQLRRASHALEEKADYMGFRDRSQAQREQQTDLRVVAAWLRTLQPSGQG
jgi:hypothetical protein